LRIPRSTIATWKQRGVRTVVSLDTFGHDQQAMVAAIQIEVTESKSMIEGGGGAP
jgi:hypothetical protein